MYSAMLFFRVDYSTVSHWSESSDREQVMSPYFSFVFWFNRIYIRLCWPEALVKLSSQRIIVTIKQCTYTVTTALLISK